MDINFMDVLLIIGVCYCVFTDIKYRKIKNYITFPLIFAGVMYNTFLNGIMGFTFSLKGLFFCGIISLIMVSFKGIGMGDAKLFIGIGAVKGFSFTLDTIIFSLFTAIIINIILKPKAMINVFKHIYYILKGALYNIHYNITPEQSSLTVPYAVYTLCGLTISYIAGGGWIWALLTK